MKSRSIVNVLLNLFFKVYSVNSIKMGINLLGITAVVGVRNECEG